MSEEEEEEEGEEEEEEEVEGRQKIFRFLSLDLKISHHDTI